MSQEQKKPKNQSRGGRRLDGQTAENREKRSGGTAAAVREEEQQMSRRSAAARRDMPSCSAFITISMASRDIL